jgi:hypothetical protein
LKDKMNDCFTKFIFSVSIVFCQMLAFGQAEVMNPARKTPWWTTGNSGTLSTTNFLGTIDGQDLVIKTTNIERARVLAGGYVGIGTAAPTATLHIISPNLGANEATLRLGPIGGGNSTVSRPSIIDFWSTFDNYGADQGPRRTAAIKAKYTGGTWGNETLIFSVGTGAGNDAGIEPLERMRIAGNGNVGIATLAPSEKLHVTGNVRFSNALMPNNLPGNTGDVLISQGAGNAPIWGPAGNVIKSYTATASRVTVPSNNTYTNIPGLTLTITVATTSLFHINTWGAIETNSTASSGGSGTRTALLRDAVILTEQTVDIVNNGTYTQNVLPWGISHHVVLSAGTYTFKVQTKVYVGTSVFAGGSSTSLANEGSMSILVIPQ